MTPDGQAERPERWTRLTGDIRVEEEFKSLELRAPFQVFFLIENMIRLQ